MEYKGNPNSYAITDAVIVFPVPGFPSNNNLDLFFKPFFSKTSLFLYSEIILSILLFSELLTTSCSIPVSEYFNSKDLLLLLNFITLFFVDGEFSTNAFISLALFVWPTFAS